MLNLDTQVVRLGPARIPSPLLNRRDDFVGDGNRVLLDATTDGLKPHLERGEMPPAFEIAGPREQVFFKSDAIACGIVTCGGLCPGLNDVIRAVFMTLHYGYGVPRVYGFRYGYAGLAASKGIEPLVLTSKMVQSIHEDGGTFLGSSRGPQDLQDMIETLKRLNVRVLFCVGGDGTLTGASALAQAILAQGLEISVVGIPKTIDNDLMWIERSFGFATAVEEASRALVAAHAEAEGALGGIGLVKLMGRHSGFITAYATLANGDVNFCLVPEVPFSMPGFLQTLEQRLRERQHAVIAVAEGAGQDLIQADPHAKDSSGNVKLKDFGVYLRDAISAHCKACDLEHTVKYIDPSYIIRSLPANALDSDYCLALGQHAVHAGMTGRTDMMVGYWNQQYTHVPLGMVGGQRKFLDPHGDVWQRVLGATGQPKQM